VSIQAVQSIHLATVLGMVGHNTTGESYYSYEELGRLMGKTGKTAYRQMRRLIKNGNVEIIEQGWISGRSEKIESNPDSSENWSTSNSGSIAG